MYTGGKEAMAASEGARLVVNRSEQDGDEIN